MIDKSKAIIQEFKVRYFWCFNQTCHARPVYVQFPEYVFDAILAVGDSMEIVCQNCGETYIVEITKEMNGEFLTARRKDPIIDNSRTRKKGDG